MLVFNLILRKVSTRKGNAIFERYIGIMNHRKPDWVIIKINIDGMNYYNRFLVISKSADVGFCKLSNKNWHAALRYEADCLQEIYLLF